jgi:hypothetical protein
LETDRVDVARAVVGEPTGPNFGRPRERQKQTIAQLSSLVRDLAVHTVRRGAVIDAPELSGFGHQKQRCRLSNDAGLTAFF